jgi:hypothetical protein
LIAVDSTDESHHVVMAARHLFPAAEHLVLSVGGIAPYPLGEQVNGVDYDASTAPLTPPSTTPFGLRKASSANKLRPL